MLGRNYLYLAKLIATIRPEKSTHFESGALRIGRVPMKNGEYRRVYFF